ncbi:MnhB domain-containing protein [Halomarina litorea]|uniref:MnhB domain-containing protein n=1 Tax=Halomarina litorea TaxID=2961595 RepID=UPI0020C45E0A|nr:MnhB domain-containing protein [Halomarina sp. BCD28]
MSQSGQRGPTGPDTDTTVIARTVTRLVVPIILLNAVALLLQGHNLPGGGFIAGVLTVTAFALVYVIFGREYLQRELLHSDASDGFFDGAVGEYSRTFTFGLALAALSGAGAIVLPAALGGEPFPFLSQAVVFVEHVPLYHEIEIPTALFFDLGVYFVVVGALLTILAVVGAE